MRASADTEWARTPGRRFSGATLALLAAAVLTMLTSIGGVVWIVAAFSAANRPQPTALAIVGAGAALWLAGGLVALAPKVERSILRRWASLRQPTSDEHARLEPIFSRVCARAREDPRQFALLVEPSEMPNASAVGYSLVAVTEAALGALPDDQLEAVLAHELGHQDALHAAAVFQSYWWSRPWVFAIGLTRGLFGCFSQLGCLLMLLLVPLILPGLLAILIQAAASRYSELEADRFAADLGYGPALAGALAKLEAGRETEQRGGVFSSHPSTRRRLGAIESRMGSAPDESPFGR